MKISCRTAKHRGGLEEMLKTEKEITELKAEKLINSGKYKYYGYDERIKALRYLLKDMQNNLDEPDWINIHIIED